MSGFSLFLIVVVLVLPVLVVAASVFHWLGEKREKVDLDREAEESRREMEEGFPKEAEAGKDTGDDDE